jgi:hypothetical protein
VYGKLLGIGAAYGFGYMLIKGLFPEPFLLLLGQEAQSEGNLTVISLVYILAGLVAGILAAPIFGVFFLRPRKEVADRPAQGSGNNLGASLTLSLGFSMIMGFISGLIVIAAYLSGFLPPGGVLDPLEPIRNSNFAPGVPLLVAWTIFREILPASLAGLFLSPLGGEAFYKLYARNRTRPKDLSERYASFEE